MKLRGLVLAGGKSTRFGSDKALAFYRGERFIERAASLLDALNLKPIVATRSGADYSFLGCTTVYDKLAEQGPLGGLYTAMSIFKGVSFLVLTCDMPALTLDVLFELLTHRDERRGVTLYAVDGRPQPFPGIYETSVFGAVRENLKREKLSLHGLIEGIDSRKTVAWRGDAKLFFNANRPQDLLTNVFNPELMSS